MYLAIANTHTYTFYSLYITLFEAFVKTNALLTEERGGLCLWCLSSFSSGCLACLWPVDCSLQTTVSDTAQEGE